MRRCFERGAKEAAVAIAVAVAVAVVVDGRSELGVPVSRLTPAFFKVKLAPLIAPRFPSFWKKCWPGVSARMKEVLSQMQNFFRSDSTAKNKKNRFLDFLSQK